MFLEQQVIISEGSCDTEDWNKLHFNIYSNKSSYFKKSKIFTILLFLL